jgi:UDP-N-acetylglucosamine 2-epimerase (non-hydrolysing)
MVNKYKEDYNPDSKIVYFSAHREENMRDEQRFKSIVRFANMLAEEYDVHWVMRIKTEQMITKYNVELNSKIRVIKNLSYPNNVALLSRSKFICTDSGSIQEEASALHIPCLTLRYATDRPETLGCGCNILTGFDYVNEMIPAYEQLLRRYDKMRNKICPYGTGTSSIEIFNFIEERKETLIRWNHSIKE